jgi:enamine deaminase RidA (YjgF/YER057c/UK114 family)
MPLTKVLQTAVLPARTTVQSVLWNVIKVEIDCVARRA